MKQQNEVKWTRLDNASKIFPSTYSERDPKVFRLSCELNEAVDVEILQEALDVTVESFPLYKTVLRRGIFWYYLESSDIRPVVQAESNPVCAPIYLGHKRNLLFRVFYYNKRINVEIFHVLSDGTGALWFMQSLVYNYLVLRYKEEYANTDSAPKKASISKQMDDSFEKHFTGGNLFGRISKDMITLKRSGAYHIQGTRLAESRISLIEGVMSAKAVLEQAHNYNTTLTIFIAALLAYSIYEEMPTRRKKQPVVLSVPINLRQYFDSVTARNFFSTMNVSYNFEEGAHDLPSVIQGISEGFQKELTAEQLNHKLNKFMILAQNPFVRVLPLQLKNLCLRIGAKFADGRVTSGISNIGKIFMPLEFDPIIRQFSVCTGARSPRVTLCTYGDRMVVSLTSPFRETDIQRTFFQLLSKMGIGIEVSSNL